MAAGTYNFTLEQGSTFSRQITVQEDGTALNLTGYTARMQMRSTHDSSTIALTYTSTIASPASNGIVNLSATATQSAAIEEGIYVYDLEIESSGGVVTRLMEGKVTVTPEVTR